MDFSILVTNRAGHAIILPSELSLNLRSMSWSAVGTYKEAEIEAIGRREALASLLNWLGWYVYIYNPYSELCWFGEIESVDISLGELSVGLSQENLYNRVSVTYTYRDDENNLQEQRTDWIENQASVLAYGARELLYSQSELESEEPAQKLAQRLLDDFGTPHPTVKISGSTDNMALIVCRGLWFRTSRKYYEQRQGIESHESYFGDQPLGVRWSGGNASFVKDQNIIWFHAGQHGFKTGEKVRISGTQNNNGVRTISEAVQVDRLVYQSNTMFFRESNDVYEPVLGFFQEFKEGEYVQVSGSAKNGGIYQIDEMDLPDTQVDDGQGGVMTADHIEFAADHFVNEAAGPTISLIRNGFFKVSESINQEIAIPGTVTITQWGQKVAQRFQLSEDAGDWPLHEIKIRVRKAGEPTDGVRVSLRADDNGLPSNDMITFAAVLHGAIGEEYEWITFPFDGTITLEFGVSYWIVIERTGDPDAENYYDIGIDDSTGYTPLGDVPAKGNYQVHTGVEWEAHPEERSLSFQVIGKRDTGQQIREMIVASGAAVNVNAFSSLVMHPIYRDGSNLAIDEIEPLLTMGNNIGQRLLVDIKTNSSAVIYAKTGPSGKQVYRVRGNGEVLDPQGRPIPPGTPLAGVWMRIDEPGLGDLPERMLTFYVEEATYDVEAKRWQLTPESAPTPFDIGIQQG